MAVGLFQPAQNPAPNPAGFAQAAAGIFDTMQQIAASSRQHQIQQQQQMLKDQFDHELKMRKEGYTPVPHDASGLARRGDIDSTRLVKDPYGRSWVAPDPKGEATPQQTYADTSALLEKGARPVDAAGNVDQMQQVPRYRMDAGGQMTDTGMFGIHAAAPEGMTVTPPGGSQSYFVPGEEEKAGVKARLDAAAAAEKPGTPTVDTEHFSAPVSIDHKTGTVTPLKLPDGVTHNEKAGKPEKYTYGHFTDDGGKVTVTRIGEDGGEKWNGKAWVPMAAGEAIGPKRKDPDAPPRTDPNEERAQRRRDAAQKQIEVWQTEEQKTHGVRQAYADVVWDPSTGKEIADGEKVVDPKTGSEVLMNAARRSHYKRQFQNATEKVGELQERQRATVKRFGGEAGGGTQQTQQGKGKLTDVAVAGDYLRRAGGDKEKARKLAKADGWEL